MRNNILQYLENTVLSRPDKPAFSSGAGEETITFSELYRMARQLGTALAKQGKRGQGVALLMERAPHQIAAFLGTVYAGDYYIPLDGTMPKQRMETILDLVKPAFLVYDSAHAGVAGTLACGSCRLLEWNFDPAAPVDKELLSSIRQKGIDTDPIYIVFTSGSTGVPKGVVANHRSVIDYTESLCEALPFTEDTVFGNQTPLFFDAPLKEIMPTLKLGATTYLIPRKLFMFPMLLTDYLNENKINTICWVVSALTMISSLGVLEKKPPLYLRLVCFGSEVFYREQYDRWRAALKDTEFYNLYGPTEATGMSCYWKADRALDAAEPIPVGRPFTNTEVLLLDADGNAVEPDGPLCESEENGFVHGRTGEIFLRGTCVTMGYFNNAEKTADAFVQNPLQKAFPEIIYRTGDLGCYNRYGELVFLTRKDLQIKIRGHRVELGDIEAAAMSLQGSRQVCAIYSREEEKLYLVYAGSADEKEMLSHLKETLPRYMIPAAISRWPSLPLTANQKLDRRRVAEEFRKNK